jgi:predicted dienelactone hydrolase
MKGLHLFALLLITTSAFAQYQIGHTTITFNDPSRTGGFGSGGGSGRQIQTEIYYPAVVAGEDVACAADSFPVIVFGHGFAMSWDAYENIWEHYAPKGYILAFPRTEGGLFPVPSHGDFGLDLNIVANRMQAENALTGSIFEDHVRVATALMGHSMGGGASALAASGNSFIKTYVGLAPAETTPSAITAASGITVPSIVFSGSEDGVTPPADHHLPIYNALSADCKTFVSITGGGHCYFADPNDNCDGGEFLTSFGITITRQEQHDFTFAVLDPWLEYTLYGDSQGLNDALTISSVGDYSTQSTCTPLSVDTNETETFFAYPNPSNGLINISGLLQESEFNVIDHAGRVVLSGKTNGTLDLIALTEGSYLLKIGQEHLRFVVLK